METDRGGALIPPKARWQYSFLAGLLLLPAEMSVSMPSPNSSLPLAATSHKALREFGRQGLQQTTAEVGAGHLSEAYRNVSCTPSARLNLHPRWAQGFIAHFAEEGFSQDVVVCDGQGKQVTSAHITIPGLSVFFVMAAVPTMEGAAIVSGLAMTNPGRTYFLAKTSTSGGIVSVIRTEEFQAGNVCEASDHTIWTLGSDQDKERAHDDFSLVQHYSFEKGLLGGYLSKADSSLSNTHPLGNGYPGAGLLVCGKERISLYLSETNEYIEIDPFTETLKRWKMDAKPLPKGMLTGLAVTENGRVYASLFEDWRTETDWKFRRGLFELRLEPNSGSGKWTVVNGTFTSLDPEVVLDGIFFKLWGADGNDLVIRRLHEADMSWVRVI